MTIRPKNWKLLLIATKLASSERETFAAETFASACTASDGVMPKRCFISANGCKDLTPSKGYFVVRPSDIVSTHGPNTKAKRRL
jgi:hypothetical protein